MVCSHCIQYIYIVMTKIGQKQVIGVALSYYDIVIDKIKLFYLQGLMSSWSAEQLDSVTQRYKNGRSS